MSAHVFDGDCELRSGSIHEPQLISLVMTDEVERGSVRCKGLEVSHRLDQLSPSSQVRFWKSQSSQLRFILRADVRNLLRPIMILK